MIPRNQGGGVFLQDGGKEGVQVHAELRLREEGKGERGSRREKRGTVVRLSMSTQ